MFCGLCVYVWLLDINCATTDEPIEMLFGVWIRMGPRITPGEGEISGGARCYAAFCQISMTILLHKNVVTGGL